MTEKKHRGGTHPHKHGGDIIVTAKSNGMYEIEWPHPEDGKHGGKVICNEQALIQYLARDHANPEPYLKLLPQDDE